MTVTYDTMLEREFQRKRKIRNIIYSKATVVFLLISLALLARPTWNMFRAKVESRQAMDRAVSELEALKAKEAHLNSDTERLGTERGAEEEIRTKFNVAKNGENVVFVVDSQEDTEEEHEETGVWHWIRSLFGV